MLCIGAFCVERRICLLETVVSTALSVDENMTIKKNRLAPKELSGKEKRICIVTGTHGDEIEGQYVCYELIRRVNANMGNLAGIVDVYPALNPLGIDAISRSVPLFDLDMNRIFPGSETGAMAEHVAHMVVNDIMGADLCIDIHSSDVFLREIPQVRVATENSVKLMKYAKMLNTDFIWVADSSAVRPSSLSYTMNELGVPTVVVEMGVGMRITKSYGEQLLDGIFAVMANMGIWTGETKPVSNPMVSTDGVVTVIHAENNGVFMPAVKHWMGITKGEHIGDIVNPFTGEIEEEIFSQVSGMVFTLREYPIVTTGSLIARILGGAR